MVSHPEVVKQYHEAMGCADLLDQLVSLYHTEIQSKKWNLRKRRRPSMSLELCVPHRTVKDQEVK